ncbi:MAG: hypothetical protein QOI64_2038 [Solirubrobacteraceae bacterium]|jgi:hypothetical protein|nr:hypothetical protein [Solirubrobacteraceae bacterium]
MRPRAPRLHRPRALLVAVAALVTGLLLTATAPAAFVPPPGERATSVRAPHCTLNGARTIAANRHVRVFRARGEVFGCRRTANRAFGIGHGGQECQNNDLIDSAVVAGNFVALNVRTCSLDSSNSSVHLVNLRDGRGRFASAPLSTPGAESGYDAIRGLAVTAAGRLAWIGVRVSGGVVVAAEVRRRRPDFSDRSVVLDSGSGIDPRSLRRVGSMLRWRHDGAARSAAM